MMIVGTSLAEECRSILLKNALLLLPHVRTNEIFELRSGSSACRSRVGWEARRETERTQDEDQSDVSSPQGNAINCGYV